METQLSFVNQLVGVLTLGIYTPMEITVTCAAAATGLLPRPTAAPASASEPATSPSLEAVLDEAAATSCRTGEPVLVRVR